MPDVEKKLLDKQELKKAQKKARRNLITWQNITTGEGFLSRRAKLPKGWLILTTTTNGQTAMAYYPDANHEWEPDYLNPKELRSKHEELRRDEKDEKRHSALDGLSDEALSRKKNTVPKEETKEVEEESTEKSIIEEEEKSTFEEKRPESEPEKKTSVKTGATIPPKHPNKETEK